jgi:hypothetical protein
MTQRASRPRTVKNDNVTRIHLNLDAVENERGDLEPFAFMLNGKEIVTKNPDELDWKEIMAITDGVSLLAKVLEPEDRKWIITQEFKGFKLRALLNGFQEHYGVDTVPNDVASRFS